MITTFTPCVPMEKSHTHLNTRRKTANASEPPGFKIRILRRAGKPDVEAWQLRRNNVLDTTHQHKN